MTVSLDSQVWIRRFHPAPAAAARLVCFPHAGGSASYFHPVSAALSPAVEVLAVQYPGRQDRRADPLVDDLIVLADQLAEVVAAAASGPLAFFGHSMGASLAFEVARRLEARGTRLLGLFASGRRAPSAFRDERFHEESDAELLAEVKRLSGTDAKVLEDDEIVRMVLPALRNDYKAAETYRYRPGPDISSPITALIGDRDPKVTEAEARQWATHTTGPFDLKTYPGAHFYLNEHHAAVNRLIGERLAAAVR
ncbi:thioesterase II family protein [Amycolatopsis sp. cmx-4-68]|uniref:thioesterase II family protein n=1 Tax=Amycolatopsis sp. cmx-4-68 TaxID=2790938 RepID=UPI00397CA2BA